MKEYILENVDENQRETNDETGEKSDDKPEETDDETSKASTDEKPTDNVEIKQIGDGSEPNKLEIKNQTKI